MTLVIKRQGMWAILYLMLRTRAAIIPLNRVAFSGAMSRLPTSIVGHSKLIVRVLASTCIIVGLVVPGWPLARLLRVEAPSLILFSLDSALLIEVVISFLHRSFHIHRSIIQVHVGGVLTHRHP